MIAVPPTCERKFAALVAKIEARECVLVLGRENMPGRSAPR